MKILQVGKFYPIRGGVEKVMYDLTLGLSSRGIFCDMLCASTEDHPEAEIKLNDYGRVLVMPTQIKAAATMLSPKMIITLRRIAKQYDIIHIHHPDPMATLALFLSGYKGKVVLHWHADILKQKTLLKLYKPLQSWLINRADLIVGTTPVYVDESPFLQHVKHKINYIPIGVLPIQADQQSVADLKEKYTNKKVIFSLGRLVEYKGYSYLIDAMKSLDDSYQLVIAGKGPLHQELQSQIDAANLNDRVKLLGFVSDEEAAAYFMASDIFCLSSTLKTEAFAIVQIEAMSCGKPILSTVIPGSGVSWVNANNVSGITVERENAMELANGIKNIFQDELFFQKLAIGSKNRYETLFTRDVMVDKCLQLYNNI